MSGDDRALHADVDRLLDRLAALGRVGAIDGGGNARLALTDADREGRDLVCSWMADLDLDVTIDSIGNVVGVRAGDTGGPPVMTGSHIDTVATGGRYDGNLGVLAGLEVIETLATAGTRTHHPLAVAFFTNEEGSRFPPDMMGSLAFVGGLPVETAMQTRDSDGRSVGEELDRIGYSGPVPCPRPAPRAFVELHIEQGPVLENEGVTIGAVDGVQGISWQRVTITGQANHAGTTPMALRHDAGYAAARVSTFVRELALTLGGTQVATVGSLDLHPDLVNVVADRAELTVDLRNTEEESLREAEQRLATFLDELAASEGVEIATTRLARFEPVSFDDDIIERVERHAIRLGHSVRRLPAGAGHDAQMLARVCPAGMVFVPSHEGISHNPAEFTERDDLAAGVDVLLNLLVELAEEH